MRETALDRHIITLSLADVTFVILLDIELYYRTFRIQVSFIAQYFYSASTSSVAFCVFLHGKEFIECS